MNVRKAECGLMVTPPVFPAVALIVATYGAANGIMTIVRGLVVPEMLTRDAYGAINGALTVPTIVAKAAAPFGAALLWAASGSYVSVLIAMLGGSLLLLLRFGLLRFWSLIVTARRAFHRALHKPAARGVPYAQEPGVGRDQ